MTIWEVIGVGLIGGIAYSLVSRRQDPVRSLVTGMVSIGGATLFFQLPVQSVAIGAFFWVIGYFLPGIVRRHLRNRYRWY